ncbi:hypothetical protein WKI68_14705 [Streptomyces sp. MS1.HAVA.3]|uniref:Uncharacterized protein n=1 Tax=Streptomyces caledonius TaxID=3134107 RepID=A0ABU8U388_9ACTN
MEELVYVAGKIVKGAAGLAYAFGDTVMALGGPDPANLPPERTGKDRADEKRGTKREDGTDGER